MDLAASLALFARGRDEWNRWAAAMTLRSRQIVAAGEWRWEFDSRSDPYPANQATQDYVSEAAALFSYHHFGDRPDFGGFVFPGYASFIASKFPRGASFRGARFGHGAGFNYGCFGATAEFDDAEFGSHGEFDSTRFLGVASFDHAAFVRGEFEPSMDGRADFSSAAFAMPASFVGMRCGAAVFADAEFTATADFSAATFAEMFFISGAAFRGAVLLPGTQFPHAVDWSEATLSTPPVDVS